MHRARLVEQFVVPCGGGVSLPGGVFAELPFIRAHADTEAGAQRVEGFGIQMESAAHALVFRQGRA